MTQLRVHIGAFRKKNVLGDMCIGENYAARINYYAGTGDGAERGLALWFAQNIDQRSAGNVVYLIERFRGVR